MFKKFSANDWIKILAPAVVALAFVYLVTKDVGLTAVASISLAALELALFAFLE